MARLLCYTHTHTQMDDDYETSMFYELRFLGYLLLCHPVIFHISFMKNLKQCQSQELFSFQGAFKGWAIWTKTQIQIHLFW